MKVYFNPKFYLIIEPESIVEWMALRHWSSLNDERGENRILIKRLPSGSTDDEPAPPVPGGQS